ncbi:MAG: hypothetical protein VYD87_10545 [Pseudomonadota bacterium]|nr:hypothetical protein [Pseudomonadota bacterium]
MLEVSPILDAALTPLREVHVADLLTRMARAIASGAEVTPEPWRRAADGRALRAGALALPSRHDFEAETAGRIAHPVVESRLPATVAERFSPIIASSAGEGDWHAEDGPAPLVIGAFRWNRADLVLAPAERGLDFAPLRHWFLEYSQPGMTDEAPELFGVLHALDDPRPWPSTRAGAAPTGSVALRIDFGSAPVAAVAALAETVAEVGAALAQLRDGAD